MQAAPVPPRLAPVERVHYRDRVRQARYLALADAEGFQEICFAIESLGIRLSSLQSSMGGYEACMGTFVAETGADLSEELPALFSSFTSLYRVVREARNDAMHTGAHARQVTARAVELCILLEEALMASKDNVRRVGDYMVKEPICVEEWQPLARARQLMLTHSFSNLPVLLNGTWMLLTEMGLARFMNGLRKAEALGLPLNEAVLQGLAVKQATTIDPSQDASALLSNENTENGSTLWLVIDSNQHLIGVISPFELI